MTRTDTIERTITVSSPIRKVWDALTVAEHLAQWFGDSAEIDLRPGGAMTVGWSEYGATAHGVIEEVDFPGRFSYRWEAGKTEDGTVWTTKVTFELSESDGLTTITVVESGFSQLPDEMYEPRLKDNTSGWEAELGDLQRMLEASSAA